MIANGAYDGVSVYDAAVTRQRNPPPHIVIPPRASSVVNTDAYIQTLRDRHVQNIAEKGRMAWQKAHGYGRRSIVETTIGRYKHIIGPKLRARSTAGQKGEVAIAICPPQLYDPDRQANLHSRRLTRSPGRANSCHQPGPCNGGPQNVYDPGNGYRDIYRKIWGK